jgi:integrase
MTRKGKTKERDYLYRKVARGKLYIYFRNPNTDNLTRLPDDENSPEFDTAYETALRGVGSEETRPVEQRGRWNNPRDYADEKIVYRPATIGRFVNLYIASDTFAKLSKGTRYNYKLALRLLKTELGHCLLSDLSPQAVDVYSARIARTKGGSVADQQINLLSNLWEFAKGFAEFKRGNKHCPTLGATRHYEHDGDGHLAWPDAVFDTFRETAKPNLAESVTGLFYTGQRGSDLVKMEWTDYDGELINVMQQKTGERIWLHCPRPLKQMLDAMPQTGKFIFSNSRKKKKGPYKHAGTLGTAIRIQLASMGFAGVYSMHGLRKNAGMELALAGCTVPEIQAVLGHKSPKMAMFYVKQAEKKMLGRNAAVKWERYIDEKAAKKVAERRAAFKAV